MIIAQRWEDPESARITPTGRMTSHPANGNDRHMISVVDD
jgi:hypothetical protein